MFECSKTRPSPWTLHGLDKARTYHLQSSPFPENMAACSYTWDYFLGMYGRITATLGYLMPIVLSPGNHDIGVNC